MPDRAVVFRIPGTSIKATPAPILSWRSLPFGLTLFVSAALLFVVQPMLGKMILPIFGGVPAVWNTCMVFFQAALLAGYAYAHAGTTWLGSPRQAAFHVGVLCLPFLALPIAIRPDWAPAPDDNPIVPLLGLLTVSVGLPFFVIATSAPLLQKWFAHAAPGSRDPYVLYAASNAGSMLGLLAYPVLIEPYSSLRTQSRIWAAAYALLVLMTLGCAVMLWRSRPIGPLFEVRAKPTAPTPWTRCRWLAYSFVPSSLLLGVTTYLSTDVAPVPLLWVIPLAIYLLSFILVFGGLATRLRRWMIWAMPPALLVQAGVLVSETTSMALIFSVLLFTFFIVAMVCHGELARTRPPARFLTQFYLWISAGGVLGGLFNALVAPFVFSSVVEYPLVLVLAAALMPGPFGALAGTPFRWLNRLLPLGLAAGMGAILLSHEERSQAAHPVLHRERSFFSVLKVLRGSQGLTHTLVHGNIRHGAQVQSTDARQRRLPLLYYFPTGPIGHVFEEFRGPKAKRNVAVVGLGVGTLASYAERDQEFAFFEIDPAVDQIARDPKYFTFLADAQARGATIRVELGDARISLGREPDHHYGMLVLDAFSGDAIPTHLLTRQAIDLFLSKLTDDGILAFHITNTYLDLKPVLAAQAQAAGLVALANEDSDLSEEEIRRGKAGSTWVLMARRKEHLGSLPSHPDWWPLLSQPAFSPWTDDYSNIFQVFSWSGAAGLGF
jgi:hypothetical protein